MYDLRFCLLSFGQQLAKGRDGYKAGLRGAKLRPAGVCNVEPCGIFDCKLPHSHMTYRAAACEGTRYAGLREAKLRPADGLRHRHSDMQSPVQLAAERTGVRSKRATLRQGAAAGCRTYVRVH